MSTHTTSHHVPDSRDSWKIISDLRRVALDKRVPEEHRSAVADVAEYIERSMTPRTFGSLTFMERGDFQGMRADVRGEEGVCTVVDSSFKVHGEERLKTLIARQNGTLKVVESYTVTPRADVPRMFLLSPKDVEGDVEVCNDLPEGWQVTDFGNGVTVLVSAPDPLRDGLTYYFTPHSMRFTLPF